MLVLMAGFAHMRLSVTSAISMSLRGRFQSLLISHFVEHSHPKFERDTGISLKNAYLGDGILYCNGCARTLKIEGIVRSDEHTEHEPSGLRTDSRVIMVLQVHMIMHARSGCVASCPGKKTENRFCFGRYCFETAQVLSGLCDEQPKKKKNSRTQSFMPAVMVGNMADESYQNQNACPAILSSKFEEVETSHHNISTGLPAIVYLS